MNRPQPGIPAPIALDLDRQIAVCSVCHADYPHKGDMCILCWSRVNAPGIQWFPQATACPAELPFQFEEPAQPTESHLCAALCLALLAGGIAIICWGCM